MTAKETQRAAEPDQFRPHRIEWSPEHIRRFWDHYSTNPGLADTYFTKMVGRSLASYVKSRVPIGTAVDIGCGRGDLIEVLIKSGSEVYGVDQSAASIEQVEERFGGQAGFEGAALINPDIELPNQSADSAFMVEVIEHLNDEALAKSLSEAHRILRRGGHLILTTPNDEDLRASESMCPECGSIYHRVQHVRSWTAETLSEYLRPFGFEAVSAEGTVLSQYTGPLGLAYRLAYRAIRKRKPHLIYIGRRT